MAKRKDNPQNYPALGRWLMFLDKPKNVDRLVYGLYALCAFLFLLDGFYKKKTYVSVEAFFGFYALYGFFMCAALVICARMMRFVLMRKEDYYAPTDTQSEDHPEHDLDKEAHQ